MPFFYSQYLKDAKPKGPPKSLGVLNTKNNKAKPTNTINTRRGGQPSPRSGGRLVWHSNIGSSQKGSRGPTKSYKPLGYKAGNKVVHFSTIEVQPFHFNWNLVDDVFYTRAELKSMGQSRFDDAATLRQQRHLDEKKEGGDRQTVDDVDIAQKSKGRDIAALLSKVLEDEDRDENVSIRGIEHFVYPDLQQEMIRRKKEVQREVLGFVRSKRPDPQGWRLAQHSRTFSQWARNVALEKGMKYCMNNASCDPEVNISRDELERFQKSTDELEASSRTLHGSQSFSGCTGSGSFDTNDDRPAAQSVLHQISEDDGDNNNNNNDNNHNNSNNEIGGNETDMTEDMSEEGNVSSKQGGEDKGENDKRSDISHGTQSTCENTGER